MGTTETIGRIEKALGLTETSQVKVFEGIREHSDGSVQEVRVEVLDAGKSAKARRYAVTLRFEAGGGSDVVGDPARTLDEALANVNGCLG